MGNQLCCNERKPQRLEVRQIPDSIPTHASYRLFRGQTNRYSDLSVLNMDSNTYIFTLKTEEHHELQVTLPVLNEIAHRVLYSNYKLSIMKQILVDPMDDSYSNTLIAVKNQLTGVAYSLKVIPFRSYNSVTFKKGLEEVWIHKQKVSKKDRNLLLTLEDAFIYGVNEDQQALVLLFERTNSTLFNVGEYRREAQWQWTLPERLTIFSHLLESCQRLKELNIVNRDIRPCNIFFLEHLNRYVVGNFSTGREIHHFDQDDLLTVSGIEAISTPKLTPLISEKSNMGIYNINNQTYFNLTQVLSYLETLSIIPRQSSKQQPIISEIYSQLESHQTYSNILATINQYKGEHNLKNIELFEDHLALKLAERIFDEKYKEKAEEHQFKTYELLGYYKQFSEMAHQTIEKNNINGESFKNAYLMKHLGYFYEQNGTGGTEYLLNSCILFCRQTELDLQYRMVKNAQEHLGQAEELYLKLSTVSDFSLNLIEINRLRALLRMQRGKKDEKELKEAVLLINKTLSLAADKNLNIEKQMKLFLAWGVIYRENSQTDLAQERLKNGLSICENAAAFSSPSSAILFKSHFLFELGIIYFNKIKVLHNPQKPMVQQEYNKFDYKGRAESYFKLSLQIRVRESSGSFEVIQTHLTLGSFYLMINSYNQAKNDFKKALIKLQLVKEEISQEFLIELNYDLGSVCYKLKQYKDAETYYRNAIKILEDTQLDDYWKYCIIGNLSLCRIQCGDSEAGYRQLQKVKEIIRVKKGKDHYDYVFLQAQEEGIRNKNKLSYPLK